ncbi:MAG: TlpA family protein disulfide reductase [Acidimicrobiia bacterium]|nr:TlpA family protein disulfide reductase [Acidimicrobiia bacterium]
MEELVAFAHYIGPNGSILAVMTRSMCTLVLSLFVSAAAFAQPNAAPPPAKTIVQLVRDAIAQSDFKLAEKLVLDDMAKNGTTPIAIEAFSWLGRGFVATKRYDEAMTYAARAYEIVEEQLKTRKLDDEARLPIALGAAIEVTALATAGQGRRSEAVMYLNQEIERYKNTSILMRLTKNLHTLSLEGQQALPWASSEFLGPQPPTLAQLKGKPVVLFLWAHWCGDCKKQGPILDALVQKYKSSGITVIAPTQRFGYAEKRRPVGPAEELNYIEQIRDEFYPWMKTVSMPVSDEVYLKYGVSTTPTYVMIDRDGKVSTYLPGQPTMEQLEPLIKKIAEVGSSR